MQAPIPPVDEPALVVIIFVALLLGICVGIIGTLCAREIEARKRPPARPASSTAASGKQGARTRNVLRCYAATPFWPNERSQRFLQRGPALVIDTSKPLRPQIFDRAEQWLKRLFA